MGRLLLFYQHYIVSFCFLLLFHCQVWLPEDYIYIWQTYLTSSLNILKWHKLDISLVVWHFILSHAPAMFVSTRCVGAPAWSFSPTGPTFGFAWAGPGHYCREWLWKGLWGTSDELPPSLIFRRKKEAFEMDGYWDQSDQLMLFSAHG